MKKPETFIYLTPSVMRAVRLSVNYIRNRIADAENLFTESLGKVISGINDAFPNTTFNFDKVFFGIEEPWKRNLKYFDKTSDIAGYIRTLYSEFQTKEEERVFEEEMNYFFGTELINIKMVIPLPDLHWFVQMYFTKHKDETLCVEYGNDEEFYFSPATDCNDRVSVLNCTVFNRAENRYLELRDYVPENAVTNLCKVIAEKVQEFHPKLNLNISYTDGNAEKSFIRNLDSYIKEVDFYNKAAEFCIFRSEHQVAQKLKDTQETLAVKDTNERDELQFRILSAIQKYKNNSLTTDGSGAMQNINGQVYTQEVLWVNPLFSFAAWKSQSGNFIFKIESRNFKLDVDGTKINTVDGEDNQEEGGIVKPNNKIMVTSAFLLPDQYQLYIYIDELLDVFKMSGEIKSLTEAIEGK